MSHFQSLYKEQNPHEELEISREAYGRRKWKVLRMLTKQQLIEDFAQSKEFSSNINKRMSKEQILKVLKGKGWAI